MNSMNPPTGYFRRFHSKKQNHQILCQVLSYCLALNLFFQNLALAAGSQIVTDDRTLTTVTHSGGNVTDITTGTIHGQNAFNSFSRFNVDAGNTVNLHVPGSAANLLNLVHNEKSFIHGVLNGIKNGSIGGNVFFANPHGFVVGPSGVVNVGSLTVKTPTQSFMDEFFLPSGALSQDTIHTFLTGNVPISETGVISIQGKVNAIEGIHLSGNEVFNAGTILSGAGFAGVETDFSDVVNLNGLEELKSGAAIVTTNGDIEIVAQDRAENTGTIASPGGNNRDGGNITVKAGKEVVLGPDSLIASDAGVLNSKGGHVSIQAKPSEDSTFSADISSTVVLDHAEVRGDSVSITAEASTRPIAGFAPYTDVKAGIEIKNQSRLEATGGDVTLSATAEQESPDLFDTSLPIPDDVGILEYKTTSATVDVENSEITAAMNIEIEASSSMEAEVDGFLTLPVNAAVVRGKNKASTIIDGASKLDARGGNIELKSKTDTKTQALAQAVSGEKVFPVAGTLAVSVVDTETQTRLSGSSETKSTGNVNLDAETRLTVDTVSSGYLVSEGSGAGVAAAVAVVTSTTHAGIDENAKILDSAGIGVTANAKVEVNTSAETAINDGNGAFQDAVSAMNDEGWLSDGAANEISTFIDKAGEMRNDGQKDEGSGGIQVAGAFAYTGLDNDTQAHAGYADTAENQAKQSNAFIKSAGILDIASNALVSASSLASGLASGGDVSIGAGVSILNAQTFNSAHAGREAADAVTVEAGGLNLSARSVDFDPEDPADINTINRFSSLAYSGSGSDGVGIAGALALNFTDSTTQALVGGDPNASDTDPGNVIDVNQGNILVLAENNTQNSVTASGNADDDEYSLVGDLFDVYDTLNKGTQNDPQDEDPEAPFGLGASVAVNIAENSTRAFVAQNADIKNAKELRLTAASENESGTEAVSGSAGGIALVPVVGFSSTLDVTKAYIDEGPSAVNLAGTGQGVWLSAAHKGSVKVTTEGEASDADTAAVGAAVGLNYGEDYTQAYSRRGVVSNEAGSRFSVSAVSQNSYETSADAGAKGAGDSEDSPEEGSLNKMLKDFNDMKDKFSKKSSKKGNQEAKTDEGVISIGAAVALTDADSDTRAYVDAGSSQKIKTGTLSIESKSNTDGSASADGSATGSKANFGVGVALNTVDTANRAYINDNSLVEAGGISVTASTQSFDHEVEDEDGNKSIETDGANTFKAESAAGASLGLISVAGGVSVNTVTNTTEAFVGKDSRIEKSGDVLISAQNNSESEVTAQGTVGEDTKAPSKVIQDTAIDALAHMYRNSSKNKTGTAKTPPSKGKATPKKKKKSPSIGVGAGVAVNSVESVTRAYIERDAIFQALNNLDITAAADSTGVTRAMAGTDPKPSDTTGSYGIAIDAAVAVSTLENTTEAVLYHVDEEDRDTATGKSSANVLEAGGHINVASTGTHSSTVQTNGLAAGDAAIGASVAVANNKNTTRAAMYHNVRAGDSLSVTADQTAMDTTEALAVARGLFVERLQAKLNTDPANKPKSSQTLADNDTSVNKGVDKKGNKKGKSSSVSMAAAVAVNDVENTTQAYIGKDTSFDDSYDINVSSGENMDVRSVSDASYSTRGSGASVFSDIGIGVGVAVTTTENTTSADIGDHTKISRAKDIQVAASSSQNTNDDFFNAMDDPAPYDPDTYDPTDPGTPKILSSDKYITTEAVAGAGSSKVALAGSVAVTTSDNLTRASLGQGVEIFKAGNINVKSGDESRLSAKAWAVTVATAAASGGQSGGTAKVAAGAAGAILNADNQIQAFIGDYTKILDAESLGVSARNLKVDLSPFEFLDNIVNADYDSMVGVNPDEQESKDLVRIGQVDFNFDDIDPVQMITTNNYYTEAAAGSVSDGTAALSGAFSVNVVANRVEAKIGDNTDITLSKPAGSQNSGLTVEADNEYQARALAGSIAAAQKVGAGISNANVITNDFTRAQLGGKVTTENAADIKVDARSKEDLAAVSLSGAGGGKAGLAGAASVVVTENTVEAKVSDNADITSDGSMRIGAVDRLNGFMIAGAGAGGGKAGVGGSGSVIVIDDTTKAYIGRNASVTARGNGQGLTRLSGDPDTAEKIKGLNLSSDAQQTLVNLAASGAGGGTAGLAGSAAVDIITRETKAYIDKGAQINQNTDGAVIDQDVVLAARDKTLALDVAGTIAGGGKIGASAGADVMVVSKDTQAYMDSSAENTTQAKALDSIRVSAENKEDLISIAVSGSAGGTAGIAGAVSTQVVTNTTKAWIGNSSQVDAQGNVGVFAQEDTNVKNVAVQGSGGGTAGVGGSVGVTTIVNATEAFVADNAQISARGKRAAQKVYTGEIAGTSSTFKLVEDAVDDSFDDENQPKASDWAMTADVGLITDREKTTRDHTGLAVTAFAVEDIDSVVAGGSGGGSAGVAGAVSVKVIDNDTKASLGKNVKVNTHADRANDGDLQDVVVGAFDHTDANGYVGAATGGGSAGVGGAADVTIVDKETLALIGQNSQINTNQDILLDAFASENLDSFTAGLGGGGSASVQGAGALAVINNKTRAYTAKGVRASAGRNIGIKAQDISEIFHLAGAIGGAGAGAVGGAAAVSVIEKETVASIGEVVNGVIDAEGSEMNAKGQTLVEGYSEEQVDTFAISGGGAGSVAVFGAGAVKVLKSDTTAAIGRNAEVNQDAGFKSSSQQVKVHAENDVTLIGLGAGIGGAGAAGIGFTADVGIVRNGTSAYIGDNAKVNAGYTGIASDDYGVDVSAVSDKRAFSLTVAGGGAGAAGIGGAASVISMGAKLDKDSLEALEGSVEQSDGSSSTTTLADTLDDQNTGSKIGGDMGDSGSEYQVGSSNQSVQQFVDARTDKSVSSDINNSTDGSLASTAAFIGSNARINADGNVGVRAKDTTTTLVTAGGVGGGGAAGIGGAAAVVLSGSSSSARILSGVDVTASKKLTVQAQTLEDMNTNTVAIGGAGAAGLAGTLIVNTVTSDTRASIEDGAKINSEAARGESVGVEALSDTNVITVGGNAGGAGAVAAGGSVDINVIHKTIRASIGKNAQVYASDDIKVRADSLERSSAAIFAGRGAGGAAVNGLANIHVIDNDTRAFIDQGAMVDSNGNVLVAAEDDAQVKAVQAMGGGAGGAAVGGAIDVTTITSKTKAYIADNAVVNARGNAGAMDVFSGRLNKDLNVGFLDQAIDNMEGFIDQAKNEFGGDRTSGKDEDKIYKQITGLAVSAASSEDIFTVAAGFAVAGGAGAVGTGSVTVVSTETEGSIGDNVTMAQVKDVAVRGSDNTNYLGVGATLSGGAGSVSGSFEGAVIDKTTQAHIGSSSLTSTGNVLVDAYSSDDINTIAANLAAGGVAVGGAAAVVPVTNKTYAYVEGGANIKTDGNLTVAAETDTEIDIVSGGVKAGGGAGAGASVGVNVVSSDTQAHIGYDPVNTIGSQTNTNAKGETLVSAKERTDIDNMALTAAVGGTAGLAISVGANVLKTNTVASIGDNAQVNQDAGYRTNNQTVAIEANDDVAIDSLSGGAAAGGTAGIGGGIDLNIIRNTTTAGIGKNANVHGQKSVNVTAQSVKQVDSEAAGGGAGIGFGVAGSFSFVSMGSKLEDDQTSRFDRGNITDVDKMMSGSDINTKSLASADSSNPGQGMYVSDHMRAASDNVNQKTSGLGIGQDVDQTGVSTQNKTLALVDSGAKVTSGTNDPNLVGIAVKALDETHVDVSSSAAAFGGIAGAGGAVGVVVQKNHTESLVNNAILDSEGDILILAQARQKGDKTSQVDTLAGAAAGLVGVGASVAILDSENTTKARVGQGSTVANARTLEIKADQQTKARAEALGVAAGAGAVGASIARTDVNNETRAQVETGVNIGREAGKAVQNFKLHAVGKEIATASTRAGAAGIISGSGADADAVLRSKVLAHMDSGANAWARKSIDISALASPYAEAGAEGVAVSLVGSAGVSLADARVDQTVAAWAGENSFLNTRDLTVEAEQKLAGGQSKTSVSSAFGAAGGLLVGGAATKSQSVNTSTIQSRIGANANIGASGRVQVNAKGESVQDASASGISVGFVAAGSNKALAKSDTVTLAYVDDGATFTQKNDLTIEAAGSDSNTAAAESGSGGILNIGPKAADAETVTNSRTAAFIGKGVRSTYEDSVLGEKGLGSVSVNASHDSVFNSTSNSTAASLFGLSGSLASNTGNAKVLAGVGKSTAGVYDNLGLSHGGSEPGFADTEFTAMDITVAASNKVVKDWPVVTLPGLTLPGYNVKAGSGGLFNGAAARSATTFNVVTDVLVGDDAKLTVNVADKDTLDDYQGFIRMEAQNDISLKDRVKLDSGGAIAVAKAESIINVPVNIARAFIGQGAVLNSDGDIDVGTRNQTEIRTSANAKTYGGAGAAQGLSHSETFAINQVSVEDNALVKARGDISLMAGQTRDGQRNQFNIFANTDLFNKTALPIETKPDANAFMTQVDKIAIGQNGALESVNDVNLLTDKGSVSAKGYGVGKDLYREVLAAIGSFVSNLFGGDDVSLDIKGGATRTLAATSVAVDGKVEVGTEHIRKVTINEDGTLDEENTSQGLTVEFDTLDIDDELDKEIQNLKAVIAEIDKKTAGDADGNSNPVLASEKTQLQNEKTGLATDRTVLLTSTRPDLVNQKSNKESTVTINNTIISGLKKQQEGLDPDSDEYQTLGSQIAAKETENQALADDIQDLSNDIAQVGTQVGAINTRVGEIDTRIVEIDDLLVPYDLNDGDLKNLKQEYEVRLALLEAQKNSISSNSGTVKLAQDITARSGNIHIQADNLTGSGLASLIAPGDTTIEITNKSPKSLVTSKLTIPDESGGNIYFNDARVGSVEDINTRNQSETAQFKNEKIQSSQNATPKILVENSYAQRDPSDPPAPALFVDNDIRNYYGDIEVNNIEGSIVVADNVKVVGDTVQISAGGDLFLGYTDGFKNVYNDKEIQDNWSSLTNKAENGRSSRYARKDLVENLIDIPDDRAERPVLIAGNSVFMAADNLNINGIIQSGIALKELTITDAAIARAEQILADYLAGGDAVARIDDSFYLSPDQHFLESMPLWFNAEEKIFEIGAGQIKGGYMELYGNIMSTGFGELRVLDGYGQIKVDNPSEYAIKLSNLDTGSGLEGMVKITDFARRTQNDDPLVTVTKRIGNDILTFSNDHISGLLDLDNPTDILGNSSQTIYEPRENQYYSWTVKKDYSWTNTRTDTQETWFFFFKSDDTKYTAGTPNYGTPDLTSVLDGYTLRVVDHGGDTYWYERTTYTDAQPWHFGDWHNVKNVIEVYKKDERTSTQQVFQEVFHNHNIAAFQPIDIVFQGEEAGTIDIDSAAGIIVDGTLRNTNGLTGLTAQADSGQTHRADNEFAGKIVQGINEYAGIIGQTVNLAADQGIGVVGTDTATESPLNIELVNGGVVDANTKAGDIRIHADRGDLIYATVAGSDSVSLSADMNISGVDSSSLISGNRIKLDARHGSIGTSKSLPVRVDSGDETGGLVANAASDMFIREVAGDLYLISAASGSQDVSIEAAAGSIVDHNPAETEDERAKEGLLEGFWKSMELVEGQDADTSRDRTVAAYERNKKREYNTYWQYRSRQPDEGTSYDSDFRVSLTARERDYYKNDLGWTDGELASLEDQRTSEYHRLHTLYGQEGNTHDQNWTYTVAAGSQEYESLTKGYAWTEDELRYSLGAGVLREVSDTEIRIEDPNVRGRDIALTASGSIGTDKGDVFIDLNKADGTLKGWKDLTEDEILTILTAERKDIEVAARDDDKGTTAVRIQQHEDVDVESTGSITAEALGNVYLGSEEDLTLADIHSGKNVIIKGQKGVAGEDGRSVHITAADLLIEAGDNSIGNEDGPVLVDLAGALTARAGDTVDIRDAFGDMNLETVYGVNRVSLEALGSILDFNQTSGLDIRTRDLFLTAGGDIGTSGAGQFIDIGLDPGGILTASAGNDIYITSDRNLTTGEVTAGGNIGLIGAQDIRILSAGSGIFTQFGNVFIDAYHSILDGDLDDTPGITAQNIDLTVQTGSIGEADNSLDIDSLAQGIFSARAPLGVYVRETDGDLNVGNVSSESGGIALGTPRGSIFLGELEAATFARLDAGSGISGTPFAGYNITAWEAELLARNGDIFMPAMQVADHVTARGTNITLSRVDHSVGDRFLRFAVESPASPADTVVINATSDYGIRFDLLDADLAFIKANTIDFKLNEVRIGTRGVFDSSRYRVILDNMDRSIQESHAQLYAPDQFVSIEFFSDRRFNTTATVVHYDDNFIVNSFSTENSINRFDGKIPVVIRESTEGLADVNSLAFVSPVTLVEGYSEPLIAYSDFSLGIRDEDGIEDEEELLLMEEE